MTLLSNVPHNGYRVSVQFKYDPPRDVEVPLNTEYHTKGKQFNTRQVYEKNMIEHLLLNDNMDELRASGRSSDVSLY